MGTSQERPPRQRRASPALAIPARALALAALLAVTGCGDAAPPSTVLPAPTTTDISPAPSPTSSPSPTAPPSSTTAGSTRPPSGPPADRGLVDDGYQGRYRATGTVLEAAGKGPQLCLGAVAASLPPQCSGPAVARWSWQAVPHEDRGGTRWGSFTVTGRYDGTRFTLTQPATVPRPGDTPPPDGPRLDTPCPPPTGGWHPPHPGTATDAAFGNATRVAEQQTGFGALWIDQQRALDDGSAPGATAANDPTRFVLDIATTGDPAVMERAVRAVWGGSLCVTRAPRTAAELARIRSALATTPGMLSVASDDRAGQALLTVLRATAGLRRDLDRRFGTGTVRLTGALQPID